MSDTSFEHAVRWGEAVTTVTTNVSNGCGITERSNDTIETLDDLIVTSVSVRSASSAISNTEMINAAQRVLQDKFHFDISTPRPIENDEGNEEDVSITSLISSNGEGNGQICEPPKIRWNVSPPAANDKDDDGEELRIQRDDGRIQRDDTASSFSSLKPLPQLRVPNKQRQYMLSRSSCVNDLSMLSEPSEGERPEGAESSFPAAAQAYNMYQAVLRTNVTLVQTLIDAGASVNMPVWNPDPDGDVFVTLLHVLSSRPEMTAARDVMTVIVRGRANLDARSSLGSTPLSRACLNKHYVAAHLLLELHADPLPMDDYGRSALHCAVSMASGRIVAELLKAMANPLEADCEGHSVLDVAFQRGDEDITTLLRDYIGDLERKQVAVPQKLDTDDNGSSKDSEEEPEAKMRVNGEGLGFSDEHFTKMVDDSYEERKYVGRISFGRNSGAFSHDHDDIIKEYFKVLQSYCRKIYRTKHFQMVMFCALLAALFFPDLWVVFDISDVQSLDILLVTVVALFLIELIVQIMGTPNTYINSFHFWTDIIGLITVPLDISSIADLIPQGVDNQYVMRAARTARLGARAGRFSKLVKLLRFLPGQDLNATQDTAKKMTSALLSSVSARVSCLIILMVMVLPLFDMVTYPENDFSMKAWLTSLEHSLTTENSTNRLKEFEHFYTSKNYFPFEVHWKTDGVVHSERLKGKKPKRTSNQLPIKAASGIIWAVFNFGAVRRVDALCNIFLMLVIIIIMSGFVFLLSNSISTIVLKPLEGLLTSVHGMASKIFESVASLAPNAGHDDVDCQQVASQIEEEETDPSNAEIELLEQVIRKLATITAINLKTAQIDTETLDQLAESDRAVLQGFNYEQPIVFKHRVSTISSSTTSSLGTKRTPEDRKECTEELVMTLEASLLEAELTWTLIDSWEFDALELEERQKGLACLTFLIFHLGLSYSGKEQGVFVAFINAVSMGYSPSSKAPYHNWNHAVDVTHCVFRILNMCATEWFMSSFERFAMVASAMCHDLAHCGFNNPFLVETKHELAMRYNDQSPLENMHCAKFFELVNQPQFAIFSFLDKQQFKEVRQICIEAILHTDNVHHFPMVKEMQMLYEMHSDVFDLARALYWSEQVEFPAKEIIDIFCDPEKKKLIRNLILHTADISNPMKPWLICRKWAMCVIEEFFLQGDKEKEMGIPVQPLNDRDKVNIPYSQIGFVEFFVVPLSLSTVRLLPPLASVLDDLMVNVMQWFEEWLNSIPEHEDVQKLQERVHKLDLKIQPLIVTSAPFFQAPCT